MGQDARNVIMAGIGGRGVMVAALTLARAALRSYKYAVWLPSMTTAMRGGPCEATVVFSSSPIASPLVWRPEGVLIMEASQLAQFVPRIIPGGTIVTEKAGLSDGVGRDDVKVLALPALARAVELTGDSQVSNLILLGAYVQTTGLLPVELIEQELTERFSGRNEVMDRNAAAFADGLKLAKEYAGV
ncbi:MAG: 2-oxoacid:acceptor oxidoreductase family protein [Dehalococcoidia bacterium]|nr:2-oxoacid:acceptor oxidoreductase family protein [Dehalococcoidia bacterium]